ncbi:hypothetical protein DAEQUDRAFT_309388 [Daedalea quercina L-15889]|uniref:Uncharacterized protein n=1 Tax=Daedalea quercina L-15889 TaxID=1314783 RepID=A0A165PYD8_9APHY|nr:hypothetical protein DAEQUDRAFT_309388 [Daedalea quercina L-15889]
MMSTLTPAAIAPDRWRDTRCAYFDGWTWTGEARTQLGSNLGGEKISANTANPARQLSCASPAAEAQTVLRRGLVLSRCQIENGESPIRIRHCPQRMNSALGLATRPLARPKLARGALQNVDARLIRTRSHTTTHPRGVRVQSTSLLTHLRQPDIRIQGGTLPRSGNRSVTVRHPRWEIRVANGDPPRAPAPVRRVRWVRASRGREARGLGTDAAAWDAFDATGLLGSCRLLFSGSSTWNEWVRSVVAQCWDHPSLSQVYYHRHMSSMECPPS